MTEVQSETQHLPNIWKGSVLRTESKLHQLGPYIGKMKSSMANALISEFTDKGQTVYDPFCGSGTVALEAWMMGRHIVANDLNPYAIALTRAKLYPITSVEEILLQIKQAAKAANRRKKQVDLRIVPAWVRSFFHAETLREILAWVAVLRESRNYFLQACLLGILHHQRPGFLSFPSSHSVPYLRPKNFPRELYPELYEYRTVHERLERKVKRALTKLPNLDSLISREIHRSNAANLTPKQTVNAIITSPPYMRQLDYGRDNRLRLWFLGFGNWKGLDEVISPSEPQFTSLFISCIRRWRKVLPPNGACALVLGDVYSHLYRMPLHEVVIRIAITEGLSLEWQYTEPIPNDRRVRRGYAGSKTETVVVFRNSTRS